jgi:hypothetical protein
MSHDCTQEEVIIVIREYIASDKVIKEDIKTLLQAIVISNQDRDKLINEHDKRITVLEVLPAQVKDIQESRTIKTDKWLTGKLSSVIFSGVLVAIVGTLITFMLFLKKIYDVAPKVP